MEWIPLGKIQSSWGIRGEVKFHLYNSESEAIFKTDQLYLKNGSSFEPISILSVRQQGKFLLIHFKNYHSPESVLELKGKEVFLPLKDLPPKEKGEFYYFELIGMEVFTTDQQRLGIVQRIENYGASEILVVQDLENKKTEVLIPMIPNLLKKVSLDEKRIVIDPPEGLI